MSAVTMGTAELDPERPLRRDAARNRALILEAGYDEIARRAGVGVGTVYRRFPERAELVQALFETRIDEIVATAERAAEHAHAFEGLAYFLEKTLERQVADRGLREVMVLTISEDAHRIVGRERLGPIVEGLVARAKADGELRAEIAPNDLGTQLMLLSSVTTRAEPDLWRRHLALLLDGIRARPGAAPLPLEPPDDEALHELIDNLHRR
jgi:AcrR family transcriptional regulator